MLTLYHLVKKQFAPTSLPDMSSLDAVTRQLPDGYYSTFRTYDACTRVIGLSVHLRRLPNIDASFLRRSLLQLLEPFRPDEARVRIILTQKRQLYIALEPLKLPAPEVYEKGVRTETVSLYRNNPRTKSTSFIGVSDEERKHISKAGIFEALLVKNGRILEGMTSNFFYVLGQTLFTAQCDILLGVTRTMVIRAARGRGVEVRYQPLKLNQVSAVKEVFITSSSRGIVPVVQIDGFRIGQGSPGRITKLLMPTYDEYVMKRAEKI